MERTADTTKAIRLWKVACKEDWFPGMWQRWYLDQCVAVGWPAQWNYPLEGAISGDGARGWSRARTALKEIETGDMVVVALKGHRVCCLGQVTGKLIADREWAPLVPVSKELPYGEMGRRVLVRWEMKTGPDPRVSVVALPANSRFSSGELRPTISEIRSISVTDLRRAMNDRANWVGLISHFEYELTLSEFIAAHPHRLEDGLSAYPDAKVRERVFDDRSRSDVLLIDRDGIPVVVECKQGAPTIEDLKQIRNYMRHMKAETEKPPRGILVHGGPPKIHSAVAENAAKEPRVEVVAYELDVRFRPCGI